MDHKLINIDQLTHDDLFELFESIPSDQESILGDESDFEEDITDILEVFYMYFML